MFLKINHIYKELVSNQCIDKELVSNQGDHFLPQYKQQAIYFFLNKYALNKT